MHIFYEKLLIKLFFAHFLIRATIEQNINKYNLKIVKIIFKFMNNS